MKIGDEVYVHGYIDEIRNDVIIIRNEGGYFGTVPSEVADHEPKRGKWQRFNYSDGDVMECTNCGYRDWRDRWLEDEVHNYCPNCGARMESDEQ